MALNASFKESAQVILLRLYVKQRKEMMEYAFGKLLLLQIIILQNADYSLALIFKMVHLPVSVNLFVTCISNGTVCIPKANCSSYQTKISCNSAGLDCLCVCVFKQSTSTSAIADTGTCNLMNSCSSADMIKMPAQLLKIDVHGLLKLILLLVLHTMLSWNLYKILKLGQIIIINLHFNQWNMYSD